MNPHQIRLDFPPEFLAALAELRAAAANLPSIAQVAEVAWRQGFFTGLLCGAVGVLIGAFWFRRN